MNISKDKILKITEMYIDELEEQEVQHAEIYCLLLDVFTKEELIEIGLYYFIEDYLD